MALLTVAELETELQVSIPGDLMESARRALASADALVLGHLRMPEATLRADTSELGLVRLATVRAVAMGVAKDIYANPLDRTSYSAPEGLSFAVAPRSRRTLFPSEVAALDGLWVAEGFA